MDLTKLKTRELGKYFEQLLSTKLIELRFEVYLPVIDKGIDLIVRKDVGKYFEVQVKSVRKRGGRLTINRKTFSPHHNLFLVFFNVKSGESFDVYVVPSEDVAKIFREQVQKGQPIYRLYTSKGDLGKIEKYKWDFDLIPEAWKT
jgi:hypothetical protein